MEKQVTVRFIKPWQSFAVGNTATFAFPIADLLINRSKKAVEVKTESKPKAKLEIKQGNRNA